MSYTLVPSKLFLKKLKRLDKSIILELEKKLEHLKNNPASNEHRMHHAYNYYRTYIGNFRLIYKVEGSRVVLFDVIKRKEGYEKFRG